MCDVCTYKSMQLYKRDTPGLWPDNKAFRGEEHVETGMLVLTDSKVSGKPWNSQWCKDFKGSCPDEHWEESKLVLEPWIITSFAALHPKSVYMDKWMCLNTIEHNKRKGFFFFAFMLTSFDSWASEQHTLISIEFIPAIRAVI